MDLNPTEDYSNEIKRLRARLRLTQTDLAKLLGVSFPTINRWENGKAKPSNLSWTRLRGLSDSRSSPIQTSGHKSSLDGIYDPTVIDFTVDPSVVRTVVEGERISFGHLSNPAFSTEIANIDPLPHQRIAVYDRMLKQARLRFLLADDAGAGKTIMTGLYIRDMLSRRLLNRIMIVSPAGLVGNWQSELQVLFNLPFKVVSGSDAKNDNPFVGLNSNQVIISIDTLAGKRTFSRMKENVVKPYDLVVFDEAHKLSCNRDKNYRVTRSERYKLAEAIAGVRLIDNNWHLTWRAHHLLLLTATPHMGKDYPYFALWRLLDPEIFATIEAFDSFAPDHRQHFFIRRTKEEMIRLDGQPLYPMRQCDTLGYELSQGENSEQALYEETTDYLKYVYNKAKVLNQSAARLAMSVFQRRLASSTYALMCSFDRRMEKLDKTIEDIQVGRITIEQLISRQREIRDEDDVFDAKSADEETDIDGMEENESVEDKLLNSIVVVSLAELIAEKEHVKKLRDLAKKIYDDGSESKFEKLREAIIDGRFRHEKLLIFTEHRDTLEFLSRRLDAMGYTGQTAQIHGCMRYTERQKQIEHFRKPVPEGGAKFMLCTDAAAEGVNLQFCWIMINYDIPWNPARLEQRMGRIHRYGQKHDPVVIINLVAPSTREGHVLKTLLDKLEKIRKHLNSDKVFDSIGRIFSDVSIKEYMNALDEEDRVVANKLDGKITTKQVKAIQEHEKRLYGNGDDVKRALPRLKESMERDTYFRLLPGYVRSYIEAVAPKLEIKIDGDVGGYFTFKPNRKGSLDSLLQTLEIYPPEKARRLSVTRPDDKGACVWLHPGEPVFDRLRELTRQRLGKDALRGAIFVDPTADKPYLFHIAQLSVIRKAAPDIENLNSDETVECRLVGIRQSEETDITEYPVEHLLLLRGGYGLPREAQRLAVDAKEHSNRAKSYLIERVGRELAAEKRKAMINALPLREDHLERGYDFQEAELAATRAKLKHKALSDTWAANELSRVKIQQRELRERREAALATIRREPELLVPGNIDFVAHALVVPSTDMEEVKRHQEDVEWIAMKMAKAFEETNGATVNFVHTPELARAAGLPNYPGFDILSIRPDGERRCIEAKGRSGTGEIEITSNEWSSACNHRSRYWLYAVYHCATPSPEMIRVQDPFENLLVRTFERTQTVNKIISTTNKSSGIRISHNHIVEVGET